MTSAQVGFAGLGAMGRGMARNLHKAGLLRAVWNRTRARADELAAELGVAAATDPAALARECDVIVLCVAADADVLAVVDALLPGLRAGALVIDCSTVSADTAREAARRLAAQGGEFLDAPVSGGVEGARDGTLAIMAGGTESAFARAQPVLQAMGRTVTHFGPSGSGQAAKATNQIMCAGVIQAVAEAMAFAKVARPAAATADRNARQRRGLQLVLREPRAEHRARCVPGRLPRAAARKGPADLPRHGGAVRRRSCRWSRRPSPSTAN